MVLQKEQREELLEIIQLSLEKLYKFDFDLIRRGGLERSLSFRFGLYFNEYIANTSWSNLNIDLEYNKNGLNSKITPSKPNGAHPDLILHRRGENNDNILIIEFKGWWNRTSRQSDMNKLHDFIDIQGEYKYGMAVFIELKKKRPFWEFYYSEVDI